MAKFCERENESRSGKIEQEARYSRRNFAVNYVRLMDAQNFGENFASASKSVASGAKFDGF